jgi:serine/threonine-protein kinase
MNPRLTLPRGEPARRVLIFAAIALSGFLLAWLVVALVLFPDEGGGDAMIVPAVVGLPYTEAERRLTDGGLKASLGETRVSAAVPRSTVMAQRPAAGERAIRGQAVSLDVSAGQQRATVPRLAGLSRDAAVQALRLAGLEAGPVTEQPGRRARGTVVSSAPDAGQVVPEGTPVAVIVSAGPAELTMPDVTRRPLVEARATIEQLGLSVGELTWDSASTVAAGLVITQSPAAGSQVAIGAVVTLRVSGRP